MRTINTLSKLHDQEKQFKRELSKTFLEYLDSLSPNKRLEQMESLLYDIKYTNRLPTLDRRLTPQEKKCLYLVSIGKEIKEMAKILGVSQRTIEYHRANITKKLEAPNLMAAVASRYPIKEDNNLTEIFMLIQALGHFYWKDTKGIYQGSNDAQAIFLGYKTGKDLIGKTDFDLPWKEQAIQLQQIDNQVMKTKKEYCIEETVNNSKGKETIFLSRKIPFYEPNSKKIIGILGVSIDLTARKQPEVVTNQTFTDSIS